MYFFTIFGVIASGFIVGGLLFKLSSYAIEEIKWRKYYKEVFGGEAMVNASLLSLHDKLNRIEKEIHRQHRKDLKDILSEAKDEL